MSIEFKMSRYGRNRKSRLHKKTARAALNSIDAPHLPMRVHTDKNGYWGETVANRAFPSYKKMHKFLMSRIGKPVDKVYSEFLTEVKKFSQNENLKELFDSLINYERDKYRGYSKGFYISNGILNYRDDYKNGKEPIPKKFIEYNEEHWDESVFDIFKPLNNTGPNLIGKFWVRIKGQYMLLPVYAVYAKKWGYSRGKYEDYSIGWSSIKKRNKECDYLREFTKCYVLGKGSYCRVLKSYIDWDNTLKTEDHYFLYIVRVSDIENYKKEKFPKEKVV